MNGHSGVEKAHCETRWRTVCLCGAVMLVACTATAPKPAPASPCPPSSQEVLERPVARAPTAADLLPWILEPNRIAESVDRERGVLVLRNLDCEREQGVHVLEHACGARISAALAPVVPSIQQQLLAAVRDPQTGGIDCKPIARAGDTRQECMLAPHNECEPMLLLVFEETHLVAVVERDDWQGPPETRAEEDRRVERALVRERQCRYGER